MEHTKNTRTHSPKFVLSEILLMYRGMKTCDVFISSFLSDPHSIAGILLARLLRKRIIIGRKSRTFFVNFRFRLLYCALRQIAKCVDAFLVMR